MQSKDYTFPWQNSSLPVKAKLLLLQLVPTQRTPVWEGERERARERDKREKPAENQSQTAR